MLKSLDALVGLVNDLHTRQIAGLFYKKNTIKVAVNLLESPYLRQ